MKIAVLIQCHKNPEQVNLMLEAMRNPSFIFFIHIDKKSAMKSRMIRRKDVIFLPDSYRVDVQWGKNSMVDATIHLLEYAQSKGDFDFYWLCSGQDFPIKSMDYIIQWFETHKENDFIQLFNTKNSGENHENNYDKRNAVYFPEWMLGKETWKRVIKRVYTELTGGYNRTYGWARRKPVNGLRFYYGSSWICLTKRTLQWITRYLQEHPEYHQFFQHCNCPDESFFQTLVMNSPYAGKRADYLHYIEWPEGKNSPKILTTEDISKLAASDKLMARKLDLSIDASMINELRRRLLCRR